MVDAAGRAGRPSGGDPAGGAAAGGRGRLRPGDHGDADRQLDRARSGPRCTGSGRWRSGGCRCSCWQRQRPPAKPGRELAQVLEIDPASPHWWEKVKLPRLAAAAAAGPAGQRHPPDGAAPAGRAGPAGPQRRVARRQLGSLLADVGPPGRPYVLEVDYPSDVPQTLGISILEPNAAGALVPIGLDSGVDVAETPRRAAHWARHRLVFWPRTTTPLVLMTNRREQSPAVYGKIRVLGGWEHLPPAGRRPGRRAAAAAGRLPGPAAVAGELLGQRDRSTPGAAAAWTTGRPSTRPARGWSSTCTTPATTP